MARTKDALFGAVASVGLPYASETWWPQKPPALPYVLVCAEGISCRHADNLTTMRLTRYRLELYSHGRDRAIESAVESALTAAGLPYSMRPIGVIDQTNVYETQFTATVVGD